MSNAGIKTAADGLSGALTFGGSSVVTFDGTGITGGIANGLGSSFGYRNKIIGGDFTTNPWQRGTSFTPAAHTSYTADRWTVVYSNDAVVNVLKTADAPTAAQAGVFTQHCLHLDVTTADATIAAAQYYVVDQRIEGLNAACFGFGQSGTRYVTLSFWHKHTKTGTYCVTLSGAGASRYYISEYTQTTTDTWEKATLTVPVDTTGSWLYDTGLGINVRFAVAAGTDYQASANTWLGTQSFATANQVNALDSTANNFKIALVQLEAGSVATPYETRSVGQELALCQRYCERYIQDGSGTWPVSLYYNAGNYFSHWGFKVEKRGTPTFSLSSAASWSGTTPTINAGMSGVTFNAATNFYLNCFAGTTAAYAIAEL